MLAISAMEQLQMKSARNKEVSKFAQMMLMPVKMKFVSTVDEGVSLNIANNSMPVKIISSR